MPDELFRDATSYVREIRRRRARGRGQVRSDGDRRGFRGAPETLGIKPADVTSSYTNLDPGSDPTAPDPLTVTVYVSSDFGSGYIEMADDGTVKQINYPRT